MLLARALGLFLVVVGLAQLTQIMASGTEDARMARTFTWMMSSIALPDASMFGLSGSRSLRYLPAIAPLVGAAILLFLPRSAVFGLFQRWGRYRYD